MGSVYKKPDKREDSSVTARGRQVSKGKYKGKGKGIAKGAKGEKRKKEHAMYICNHNMCNVNDCVVYMFKNDCINNTLYIMITK